MMKHPSPSFLYLEIAESMRRRIISGELQPGDRLPTVRATAARWNCTPGTVSRAYTTLTQEGLVEGRRGGGTRVKRSTPQPDHPVWQWASLVNRAEQFLLEAISSGYSPEQVEAALSVSVSRWRDMRTEGLPEPSIASAPDKPPLRFAGSHDLLINSVTRMLTEHPSRTHLSVEFTGSLGGLMALARNEVDIAGAHLWDETTDSYNVPFVERLLPGRRLALLTLADRHLGLILPPGNPQQLSRLSDLGRPDVHLVNRQPGSGTRVWMDAHLSALGIQPSSIAGYEREELTHLAVARAVGEGEATAGLGIQAAAAAMNLAFVPLTREQYELVIPGEIWDTPAIKALREIISSPRLRELVDTMGGYETSMTGEVRWVAAQHAPIAGDGTPTTD